jgi:hypothetical protein
MRRERGAASAFVRYELRELVDFNLPSAAAASGPVARVPSKTAADVTDPVREGDNTSAASSHQEHDEHAEPDIDGACSSGSTAVRPRAHVHHHSSRKAARVCAIKSLHHDVADGAVCVARHERCPGRSGQNARVLRECGRTDDGQLHHLRRLISTCRRRASLRNGIASPRPACATRRFLYRAPTAWDRCERAGVTDVCTSPPRI